MSATVIPFGKDARARKKYVPPATPKLLTQQDLAEYAILAKRAVDARRLAQEKRREIKKILEAGGAFEPGLRSARIVITERLVVQ